MINFPIGPSVGQVYTEGVKSWKWNGAAWDLMSISDAQVTRAESAATRAEAAATQIGTAAAFTDSNPIVKGSSDASKQLKIEVDSFDSGATHTLIAPNRSGTIATLDDVTDAGDVRLIASVVPGAASFVDLAGVFSGDYERYLISFVDVVTSNGNGPSMRVLTGANVVRTDNIYIGGTVVGSSMTGATQSFGAITPSNGGDIVRFSGDFNVFRSAEFAVEGVGISRLNTPGLMVQRYAYIALAEDVTGIRLYMGTGTFNAGGRINVYAFSKT